MTNKSKVNKKINGKVKDRKAELVKNKTINVAEEGGLLDTLKILSVSRTEDSAFEFIRSKSVDDHESLTYSELYSRSRKIGSFLNSKVLGNLVLLSLPTSSFFITSFLGCLEANKIAIPQVLPDSLANLQTINNVILDSGASAIICLERHADKIIDFFNELVSQGKLSIIVIDKINMNELTVDFEPDIESENGGIAYLQYTSGSTGKPKGVIVTHENLLSNFKSLQSAYGYDSSTISISWLPPYHDMGLVGGYLLSIYFGSKAILLPSTIFLKRPAVWLQAISKFKVTAAGGPNFGYDYCISKLTPMELKGIDLSSVKVLVNGAEPIKVETMQTFLTMLEPYGLSSDVFYPCYGMAESVLLVTAGRYLGNSLLHDGIKRVSCGMCDKDHHVQVVSLADKNICEELQVGEIWISGPSVSPGYFKKSKFDNRVFNERLENIPHNFLRSGDLGFVSNGELYITGRIKETIVIRGKNYYPNDIEATISTLDKLCTLNDCAVFCQESLDDNKVVVVQKLAVNNVETSLLNALFKKISVALAQNHGLQVAKLVVVKNLYKTTSGKIQRTKVKEMYENGELNIICCVSEPIESLSVISPSVATFLSSEDSKKNADRLIDWLQSYSIKRINSQLIDERRCIPPYIVMDFGNKGLLGMLVSPRLGGLGLGVTDSFRVVSALASIDMTLALFVGLHQALGIGPILGNAKEHLQEKFVNDLAKGRVLAAFALTEVDAGSDPRQIKLSAKKVKGGWEISGQKIWSGNASWSTIINVFGLAYDENNFPLGMTGFVVDTESLGLTQGPEAFTMGFKGMVQNTVIFEKVFVPDERVLGQVGKGFDIAKDAMMLGRVGIAAMAIGAMRRSIILMRQYGEKRIVSTGRLIESPVTIKKLSEHVYALVTSESLLNIVSNALDNKKDIPQEIYAVVKVLVAELAWSCVDDTMQLLGGRGYIDTNGFSQVYRDTRLLRIFEGPTEALQIYVGSSYLANAQFLDKYVELAGGDSFITADLKSTILSVRALVDESLHEIKYKEQLLDYFVGDLVCLYVAKLSVAASASSLEVKLLTNVVHWIDTSIENKTAEFKSSIITNHKNAKYSYLSSVIDIIESNTLSSVQNSVGGGYQLDKMLRIDVSLPKPNEEGVGQTSNIVVDNDILSSSTVTFSENEKNICKFLQEWIALKVSKNASDIDISEQFLLYGLDSIDAVELVEAIETEYDLNIDTTVAWSYPTIKMLASYIRQRLVINDDSVEQQCKSNEIVQSNKELIELLKNELE